MSRGRRYVGIYDTLEEATAVNNAQPPVEYGRPIVDGRAELLLTPSNVKSFLEAGKHVGDCIEYPRTFWFGIHLYTSARIAFHLKYFGEIPKNIYRTCGNNKCCNPEHLTGVCVHKGITCWGERFENIKYLWMDIRCLVRTLKSLRERLALFPPEQAVIPDWFTYQGKRYRSIRAIPLNGVTRYELTRRLGAIWHDKKIHPDLAMSPEWQDMLFLKQVDFGNSWIFTGSLGRAPSA
jgi:hypothetical protein